MGTLLLLLSIFPDISIVSLAVIAIYYNGNSCNGKFSQKIAAKTPQTNSFLAMDTMEVMLQ